MAEANRRKVLITGGTGFIGSRLTQTCLQAGDTVRVLGQANTTAEAENLSALRRQSVEVVEGSVLDQHTVARALTDIDVVFHLAAAQHEAGKPDEHFRNTNVNGTRNMLDGSVSAGVRRFVHGSTIGVYKADGGVVRDSSPTIPDNIYGVTKLEAEAVIATYRDRLPIVTVRISETYGPGDRRLLKLFKQIQKQRYFHIGPSDNLHHPVFIEDLIQALRLSAEKEEPVGETFVVPGYEVVTTREMATTIADVLGVAQPTFTVPLKPLWIAAGVMETLMRPMGVTPPLHRRRMHFFTKSFDFSGDRARELTGYEPQVSFRDGVRLTAEWYRQGGYID